MILTKYQRCLALATGGAILLTLIAPVASHYAMKDANERAEEYLALPMLDLSDLKKMSKEEYEELQSKKDELMTAAFTEMKHATFSARFGNWSGRAALLGLFLLWCSSSNSRKKGISIAEQDGARRVL